MNISTTNIFARFYKWTYGKLPDDFCTLFWGIFFSLTFLILHTPWTAVANRKNHGTRLPMLAHAWLGVLSYFVIFSLGFLVIQHTVEFFIALGSVAFIVLFVYLIYKVLTKDIFKVKSGEVKSPIDTVTTVVDNVKGKYCTKITWKQTKS